MRRGESLRLRFGAAIHEGDAQAAACYAEFLKVLAGAPGRLIRQGSVLNIDTTAYRSQSALMPRQLRIEYPGAIYHVVNRGDRREPIVRDDGDRKRLLESLGEACARNQWQVHALCLMGDHFHLVLETPRANLVAGMKWLLGTYTIRFNRRHRLSGHVFSGRYQALVVDADSPGHFRMVCEYVHLNPVRARLLSPEQALQDYVWSSYPEYLKPPSRRWPWLHVDRLLGAMQAPKDSAAARRRFARLMEARRHQDSRSEEWAIIRQGWLFGRDRWKQARLAQASQQVGTQHYGAQRRESGVARAEAMVGEELTRLGWTEADLTHRRKGDPGKVQLARRLREQTRMPLAWIARRLQMGVRTHVSNLLRTGKSSGRENVGVKVED